MPVPLRLTVHQGDALVGEHLFERDIVKIGRLASAHLKLEDSRVSRIHAVIEAGGDGRDYAIIDMGSTEGTFVNGRKVSKEKLSDGDEISLGDYRVVVGYGAGRPVAEPRMGSVTGTMTMATEDVVEVAPESSGVFRPSSPVGLPQPSGVPAPFEALGTAPATSANLPAFSRPSPWGVAQDAPLPVAPAPFQGAGHAYGETPQQLFEDSVVETTQVPSLVPEPVSQVPMNGYHPGWIPPPSVPNNLASAQVPDDERALEIKLIWGSTVLDTVTVTEQPEVTLGDDRRVAGFGPFQRIVRCDLEVPSYGLPSKSHVLARRQGAEGTTYLLELPPGFVGRVERADGLAIPVELIYAGEHGGEPDGAGGVSYLLRAEETLFLGYGHLVLQVRYVRRTQLAPVPFLSRVNYVWANTLVLAFFIHLIAITSFIATAPEVSPLTDELFENRNRFLETRLTRAEQKKKEGGAILDKLRKGPGEKAKGKDGKAGRRDAKKSDGKMASKGRPDEKEQARRALDKLLGTTRGSAKAIFGGRGLGGQLQSAMGSLRGRTVGDARGLGGLGTRGTGPGGGGLSVASVGIGDLGTRGRGGGGEGGSGYGSGAANLGRKRERDVEITAGQAIVRGSLSKEIIRRVINQNRAQIRYCYEKELQRSPGLYGKVATKFIIDASGLVTDAKVYQTTMNNREVERCITAKIRGWKFPKPKGGGIVVVKYPFLLKAS